MISVGNTIKTIDSLKKLYDNEYPCLNLELDIRDKWRIVFRISSSPLYSK